MTIEMEDVQIQQRFYIAYSELRAQFINISRPYLKASEIDLLKTKYSTVINSTRTSDYIKDIEGLLRTLEKRGELSYNNIEILKYISKTYVQNSVLENLLRNYESQPRPLLPPHNRYLALSGKYSNKRPMSPKAIASNQSVIPDVNLAENQNECFNRVLEDSARNRTSSEDLAIAATETLITNNVPTLPTEQRNVANDRIYFVKVRDKLCSTKYCIGVMGAFLGATLLIVLIYISNIHSVESPANTPRLQALPGTSRDATIFNNASEVHRQPIQVTLYTTQPAFRITLPGSLEVGPTKESSTSNESEVMTIVFQELSEKLGRHWRNVARHLRVTEHDIDEIDHQSNLTLSEKALKALLKFQSKCDPLEWKSKLKYSLDKSRRRDLMELVDELSSRKY